MSMTKREKALARFYGEIKTKFEDNPKKGLEVMKDVKEWAEKHTETNIQKKEKEGEKEAQTYKKKVPKYSVDTIKEKAREKYPELAKPTKKTKEEEVLEYFQKKLDEQNGQTVEA